MRLTYSMYEHCTLTFTVCFIFILKVVVFLCKYILVQKIESATSVCTLVFKIKKTNELS